MHCLRNVSLGALAAGLCLWAAGPGHAQSAAPAPTLTAEQAIQLFAEAGFVLQDARPVNRCGRPSNPRVAFVDLDGDGRAEAHIADVAPDCYGKPGAYFAILAREPDGGWRRLIAEDGIVGFARTRTAGWNDLSLEARDSACPGARRFNGTDYGAPTACAAFSAAIAAGAAPDATAPAALTGSREERLAGLLRNVVARGGARSWDAVMAAFPGARWEARKTQAPNWAGATHTQAGLIDLAGSVYHIGIEGTAERVSRIDISSPGNDNVAWDAIEAVLPAVGMQARNVGCHSPTGFGYVRLAAEGYSEVLHKYLNYGTMVPSTDVYAFMLDDPFDSRTEAEVAADRSLC